MHGDDSPLKFSIDSGFTTPVQIHHNVQNLTYPRVICSAASLLSKSRAAPMAASIL